MRVEGGPAAGIPFAQWVARTRSSRIWIPLAALTLVCVLEATLHRHKNLLVISSTGDTSLAALDGWYPHTHTYDNDRDNEVIHPEGYETAYFTFTLAGRKQPGQRVVNLSYPPSKYRLLQPFLASFLLKTATLRTAYWIVNTLVWVLAAWSTFWLGRRIFQSPAVGLIAGLFCATSYVFIVVVDTDKAEMFQLGGYFGLAALSMALGCYESAWSSRTLAGTLVMGLIAGLGLYAGNTTLYFLAFFTAYSAWSVRLPILISRGALLLLVMGAASFAIGSFTDVASNADLWNWIKTSLLQPEFFRHAWRSTVERFQTHFIHIVPLPLWLGFAIGLFLLKRDQFKIIACMFTTLAVSEVIMIAAQQKHVYNWTINYYYLQILLPIYLVNARLLWFLAGPPPRAGAVVTGLKRAMAVALTGLTLFLSHLDLLGNKYNYYNLRPTRIEVLYHSYFTYDNLDVYRELVR